MYSSHLFHFVRNHLILITTRIVCNVISIFDIYDDYSNIHLEIDAFTFNM